MNKPIEVLLNMSIKYCRKKSDFSNNSLKLKLQKREKSFHTIPRYKIPFFHKFGNFSLKTEHFLSVFVRIVYISASFSNWDLQKSLTYAYANAYVSLPEGPNVGIVSRQSLRSVFSDF